MNYKTHRTVGVCAGVIAASTTIANNAQELLEPVTTGIIYTTIAIGLVYGMAKMFNKPRGTSKTSMVITGIVVSIFHLLFSFDNIMKKEYYVLMVLYIIGGYLGSLLPDIDKQSSKVGSSVKPVSFIIENTLGHRSLFHAPVLYIPLWVIVITYARSLSLDSGWMYLFVGLINGCFIGVFSHIIADLFNKKGLPIFYPFSKKTVRIIGFKMGGVAEKLFATSVIICSILYVLCRIDIGIIY